MMHVTTEQKKRIGQALVILALGFLGMGLFQLAASVPSLYRDLVFLHQARVLTEAAQRQQAAPPPTAPTK